MFNLISTIISTSFQATVLISAGVAGFTYLTKPTDASLGEHLSKNAPPGGQTAYKYAINNTAIITDYVCVKIATIPFENTKYIGIVHLWYPIKY